MVQLKMNKNGNVENKELFDIVEQNFQAKFDVIFNQYSNDVKFEGVGSVDVFNAIIDDVTRDLKAWAVDYKETITCELEQHYIDFFSYTWEQENKADKKQMTFTELKDKIAKVPYCHAWEYNTQTIISYSHHGTKFDIFVNLQNGVFTGGSCDLYKIDLSIYNQLAKIGLDVDSLKTIIKAAFKMEQNRQNKLIEQITN